MKPDFKRNQTLAVLLAAASAMLTGQIVHPLAQARYDQGPVEATFRLGYIQMMFQQTAAQRTGLDQLLAAQRDPSSPDYHHWLTPEQYADRFGVKHSRSRACHGVAKISRIHDRIHGARAGLGRFQRHGGAGASGISNLRAPLRRRRRNTFRGRDRT